MRRAPDNLGELLDRLDERSRRRGRVALQDVVRALGSRSFGPLLLVAGLITLSPLIGDIPGMPTLMGLFVVLIAGQLVFGREHFWLPAWLLGRSVASDKLQRVLKALRRPARFVDRLLRPRLTALTGRAATLAVAAACLLIGAAMPMMELIPFSANLAGLALSAFGLALIARDGLFALFAIGFTFLTIGLALHGLL